MNENHSTTDLPNQLAAIAMWDYAGSKTAEETPDE